MKPRICAKEAVLPLTPRDAEPHAVTRARERFGLNLTADDLRQITAKIRCGLSLLQARTSNGCERHAVRHLGTYLPVVFDPKTRRVVTVLPNFRLPRIA